MYSRRLWSKVLKERLGAGQEKESPRAQSSLPRALGGAGRPRGRRGERAEVHPRGAGTCFSLSLRVTLRTRSREPPPASWRPGPTGSARPPCCPAPPFPHGVPSGAPDPWEAQDGKVAIGGLNPKPGSSGRGGVQAGALFPEGRQEARRGRSRAQSSPGESKCGGGNPAAYPRASTDSPHQYRPQLRRARGTIIFVVTRFDLSPRLRGRGASQKLAG